MSDGNTGRTFYDLLVDLKRKIGFWLLLAIVVIFGAGWLITHFLAKPGAPVSVWNLFNYTKAEKPSPEIEVSSPGSPKPDSPPIAPEQPEPRTEGKQYPDYEDFGK